ncbi:MAG: hypothetical protein QM478_02935 [Flavobacteriaceae bacterium]
MKQLFILFLSFAALQLNAQKNVEVGRTTTNHLTIINMYNTDSNTVVVLNAKTDSTVGLTLYAPDDDNPFILSDFKGNRFALIKQDGWDGPNNDGFGSIDLQPNKSKEFKLYFNKIDDLENIYSMTEVNCDGDGCWNFYDIEVSENDDYYHPEDVEVEFEKVWIDYDVYNDDSEYGMRIHTKFTLRKMEGKLCYMIIRFINAEGEFLTSTSYKYSNNNGELRIEDSLRPGYENAVYSDSENFLPYSEFNFSSGDYYLKMDIDLVYANGDLIKHLKMYSFTFSRQ